MTSPKYLAVPLFSLTLFTNELEAQDFIQVQQLAGLEHVTRANGVAVADYDQDGDVDIFFVSHESFDQEEETTWDRLFQNNGNGTFKDVTLEAGFEIQPSDIEVIRNHGAKFGAAWGDYNNDGFPDLFLTNSGDDQLYRNQGDGRFLEVTDEVGLNDCDDCQSTSGLWWDYDRDGDLDLYVSVLNTGNFMYENQGDDTFLNVTTQTGLGDPGITWASVAVDVGQDGILDLYVVNDFGENMLYEGQEQNSYRHASEYGLDNHGHGMGVAIGDYNNDGLFDIYLTNISGIVPNPLFTNTGQNGFAEMGESMGVHDAGWGWGTQFFDYDNDGDEDLYAVNGVPKNYVGVVHPEIDNVMFKNLLMEGGEGFIDWSLESGADGEEQGRGLEIFDFDQDGDLDMVVANHEASAYLYRNELIKGEEPSTGTSNWIKIWLQGTTSNRDALGSKVKVTVGNQSYHRYHHGAGYLRQSLKPVHFGLGVATKIDELEVTWPTGEVEMLTNVAVNQTLRLVEGEVVVTAVEEPVGLITYQVFNYPNPFNTSTTFRVRTAKSGVVDLRIFSITGKEVFKLNRANHKAGSMEINWAGADTNGNEVPPGVYFYSADFEGNRVRGKLVKVE